MELMKEAMTINETVYADTTQVYVEGDIIVPDVKPDILKILQVDAVSAVTSKNLSDGRVQVSGKVNLTILYIPEREGDCIQSINSVFDFSEKIERQGITGDMQASVETDVERVEFNLINSRKLSVKSTVALDCNVCGNRNIEFVSGFEDGEAEYRKNNLNVNSVIANEEFEFVMRDSMEVPAGKVSVGEILKVDAKITDKDVKPLTGKLVAKGMVNICVLYVGDGGSIEFMETDVPFTEVFDVDMLTEDTDCELDFAVTELHYELEEDSDGDRRILSFELLVTAHVKASQNMEIDMISDFFCPGCSTNILYDDIAVDEIVCKPKAQNTLREIVAVDNKLPQVTGVYNVITKPCITRTAVENGKVSVEGRVEAYILYLTDNMQSPVYSYKKDIPFSYLLDSPQAKAGMDCMVKAEVEHTGYNLNAANEVELRCILSISANVVNRRSVRLISDCEIEPLAAEHKKGIVIYFVQNGDTMWDIAKQYAVSMQDIMQYNGMSEEEHLCAGKKLVIPAVYKK
ncbi:MAG TPA: DUF3794 domain-containing protein [Candidatus Avimonoglobus intestinipullorum]|uniref:DUF3794 domain-containing protein n=1 Tax=Candidatus Avimonoglobus intestinipullorum TaxID=2840699 RepID=A0A9D1LWK7_9FIRM|nr:DUF3794 domain-containing protein [Candidatus Avimonoglobus intestinipullorum]